MTFRTEAARSHTETGVLLSAVWRALSAENLSSAFDVHDMNGRPKSFRRPGKVALCLRDVPFVEAGADTVDEAIAAAHLLVGCVG